MWMEGYEDSRIRKGQNRMVIFVTCGSSSHGGMCAFPIFPIPLHAPKFVVYFHQGWATPIANRLLPFLRDYCIPFLERNDVLRNLFDWELQTKRYAF